MNYLTYASSEMFSSTELIRKSKMIFDKVGKHEIEKAIILRDGKPSFMLLDFEIYEKIMNDYLRLKGLQSHKIPEEPKQDIQVEKKDTFDKEIKSYEPQSTITDDIDEIELEKALAEIDELNIDEISSKSEENSNEQPLKEFWD